MERLADWLKILEMDSQVYAEAEAEGETQTEYEREVDEKNKGLVEDIQWKM